MIPEYQKAETFSLGKDSGWGESFIQKIIADDPSVLGLGKLDLLYKEKYQPGGGRLDFLLGDPDRSIRYVVEVQLGAADPSHIIRAVEYWDLERTRKENEDYKHIAVLVAENITGRFFNVISLLGQLIPFIGIQVAGIKVAGPPTLTFTKILNWSEALDDEPANEPYWQQKTNAATMASVNQIISLFKEIIPASQSQLLKSKIVVRLAGEILVKLRPRKHAIRVAAYLRPSPEVEEMFNSAGVDYEDYDQVKGKYQLELPSAQVAKLVPLLKDLFVRIRDEREATTTPDE